MNRTITLLLLFLFVGSQAEGLVQVCAEWLCPERRDPCCCHHSLPAKAELALRAPSRHCSPPAAETPLELGPAFCCENPSHGNKSLFHRADRFSKDTFRQFLVCLLQPSGKPLSPGVPGSADGSPPSFLQDLSPPDLHSPVLRI